MRPAHLSMVLAAADVPNDFGDGRAWAANLGLFIRIIAVWLVLDVPSGASAAGAAGVSADISRPASPKYVVRDISTLGGKSGPYCGVYCLYNYMRLRGMDVDILSLIRPEFIGHHEGSSMEELGAAAGHYGIYTLPLEGLTPSTLRSIGHQAILHVKRDPRSDHYDHFILLLEVGEDGCRVLDPLLPAAYISRHELGRIWGGRCLVVSTLPIDANRVLFRVRGMQLLRVVGAVLLLLAIHSLRGRYRRLKESQPRTGILDRTAASCLVVLFGGALLGMTLNTFAANGLLSHPTSLGLIQGKYFPRVYREASIGALSEGGESRTGLIIDARSREEYEAGHIPGAVNVPVSVEANVLEYAMALVPREAPIIVYCSGKDCGSASVLCQGLDALGFTDLAVYTAGWEEWQRSKR